MGFFWLKTARVEREVWGDERDWSREFGWIGPLALLVVEKVVIVWLVRWDDRIDEFFEFGALDLTDLLVPCIFLSSFLRRVGLHSTFGLVCILTGLPLT